jgi:hypothetical protein
MFLTFAIEYFTVISFFKFFPMRHFRGVIVPCLDQKNKKALIGLLTPSGDLPMMISNWVQLIYPVNDLMSIIKI